MQVIEHQYIHYKNLLTFEVNIDYVAIPEYTKSIAASLGVLQLKQNGNIIFKIDSQSIQFIIPVDRSFNSSEYYEFKKEFKIVNAVRVRHYGDFNEINRIVDDLSEYIREHSMVAITPPYYSLNEVHSNVYDVYIGLSENVL